MDDIRGNWKSSIIVIVIAAIIILSIVIVSVVPGSGDDRPVAVIYIENEISRIGEPVRFIGEESKGDIIQYRWDFGDGTTSEEQNPTHAFNETYWFNVTLVVKGNNEMKSETTAVIGIQPPDNDLSDSRGSGTAWRPDRHLNTSLAFFTPNIGDPMIELQLNVLNPVGSISINAHIVWENPDTGMELISFYSEEYIATGNNIDIHLVIEPDDIPDEVGTYWSYFEFSYLLDEGMDGGVDMTVTAEFPVDNLEPPWQNE